LFTENSSSSALPLKNISIYFQLLNGISDSWLCALQFQLFEELPPWRIWLIRIPYNMEKAGKDEGPSTSVKEQPSISIRIPLSFVAVDPGDRSKQKANTLIRAHASRAAWTDARRSSYKVKRTHHRQLVPKDKVLKWRPGYKTDQSSGSSQLLKRVPDEDAIAISLPAINLNTRSFDPFETYPSSLPSEVVSPLIDQGQYARSPKTVLESARVLMFLIAANWVLVRLKFTISNGKYFSPMEKKPPLWIAGWHSTCQILFCSTASFSASS